jgi:predicted MFS family arabinose efflux permease
MVGMVATGLGIHRIPYLSDRGIDESSLSGILILIAVGMILGAYFWATLTTKIRGNIVISMNLFGMAFTVLFLMNVNSAELAYIYAFLDGLMISGSQTLMLVVMANYFGRGILGRIRGITTPVWNAGFALGPLFAGLVYDFNDSYTFAFVTFIVLSFVAGILASGAQKPKVY